MKLPHCSIFNTPKLYLVEKYYWDFCIITIIEYLYGLESDPWHILYHGHSTDLPIKNRHNTRGEGT